MHANSTKFKSKKLQRKLGIKNSGGEIKVINYLDNRRLLKLFNLKIIAWD